MVPRHQEAFGGTVIWRISRPIGKSARDGYTLKLMEPHIPRVQMRFEKGDRVAWEVNPKKLLGR